MGGLFEELRAGDAKAQTEVDRVVRGFARHLCRGGGPAGAPDLDWEDVAQEACRKLFDVGLDQYRGHGSERSYLFSIVKASIIQMARTAERRRRREQLSASPDPGTSPDPERRLDVVRVLAALDPGCREIIDRAILRDEPYADLARALGIAESSVRAKLSRCIKKARGLVAEEERS